MTIFTRFYIFFKISNYGSKVKSCEQIYYKRSAKCYVKKETLLKLVSVISYQIFASDQMIDLHKLWKMFLIDLKSSFCYRDIQIFVFPSSPLFLPVSHCFRGWWKINLKVCDVINCLSKNLITHFVWYLKKKKRYDIETLTIGRVLNKEHLYWTILQKMCTRGYSQTPF